MDDQIWEPGQINRAWEHIHRSLLEAMKTLPRQTLIFFADRAFDSIIRANAREVLDWQQNRRWLPDWGWRVCRNEERLRARTERFRVGSA